MVATTVTWTLLTRMGMNEEWVGFPQKGYVEKEKLTSSSTSPLCKGDYVTLLTHAHLNR